jgi:hypothetical protein
MNHHYYSTAGLSPFAISTTILSHTKAGHSLLSVVDSPIPLSRRSTAVNGDCVAPCALSCGKPFPSKGSWSSYDEAPSGHAPSPCQYGYSLGLGDYARASAAPLLGAGAEMCKARVGVSTRNDSNGDNGLTCWGSGKQPSHPPNCFLTG